MSGVTDYFLLRVAGLPFEALGALECRGTLELVREVESLAGALLGGREALCEEVHRLAAAQTDSAARLRLIELKRCIYNLRPPGRAGEAGSVAAETPLRERLEGWEAAVRRLRELRQLGDRTLHDDLAAARRGLRESFAGEQFKTGLLLTNPGLYAELLQYLACSAERPSKKLRRFELTALTYFYRMATKTSPFSTFTCTGYGLFEGPERLLRPPGPPRPRSSFTLNAAVPERLNAALCSRGPSAPGPPLRVNGTAVRCGGEFLFIARRRGAPGAGGLSFEESFSAVDASRAVELVWELAGRGDDRADPHALARALHEGLGGRVPEERLRAFIAQLMDCGFLVCTLDYEANSPRALDALALAAGRAGRGGPDLVEAATSVGSMVERLAAEPPSAQAETLRQIGDGVRGLMSAAGAAALPDAGKDLVRQDCYFDGLFRLSPDALRGVSESLTLLTLLMPAFNTGYLLKRLVRKYLLERYGARRVPLTRFLKDFYSECYQPVLGQAEAAGVWDPYFAHTDLSPVPEVAEAAHVRRRFVNEVLRRVGAAEGGEVSLPPELFRHFGDAAGACWPRGVPLSVGYLGQPYREVEASPELSFVLNQVLSGYGTYFARYCDDRTFGSQAALLARRVAEDLGRDGGRDEPAEIIATLGLNVQIHPPLTRRRIAYPAEPTGEGEYIPWSELFVEFDEERDSASLTRGAAGGRVWPLKMGPLSPHLLPVPYRVLASFGPFLIPDFALLPLLEHELESAEPGVRHYPRLRLRNVTLLRETWRVPREHAPPFDVKSSGFDNFTRLRGWARGLGLPRKVFVVPMEMTDFFRGGRTAGNIRRFYKPFMVDFDNPISCRLFQRLTQGVAATLTVSEMLPAPAQSAFVYGGRHYAAEMLLECYSPRRVRPARDG